jgi:hypothetical protein
MYNKLIKLWNNRQAAIKDSLYPDGVQAAGGAFAQEWNSMKIHLCEDYSIKLEDFNYTLTYEVMTKVVEDHG